MKITFWMEEMFSLQCFDHDLHFLLFISGLVPCKFWSWNQNEMRHTGFKPEIKYFPRPLPHVTHMFVSAVTLSCLTVSLPSSKYREEVKTIATHRSDPYFSSNGGLYSHPPPSEIGWNEVGVGVWQSRVIYMYIGGGVFITFYITLGVSEFVFVCTLFRSSSETRPSNAPG